MPRSQRIVSILLVCLVIASVGYTRALSLRVERVLAVEKEVAAARDSAIASVEGAAIRGASAASDSSRRWIDGILSVAMQDFSARLQAVVDSTGRERERLLSVRAQADRAQKGLPELVSLDDLSVYYAARYESCKPSCYEVETFQTAQGAIAFGSANYSFNYVPSTKELAWVRVGKANSELNAELIHAWLDESAAVKERLGYSLSSKTTRPSDYGETTEKVYRKGDLFFRTVFQYQRVQGTYARHSLQYTFYAETGSTARTERFRLEQYNKKLGS